QWQFAHARYQQGSQQGSYYRGQQQQNQLVAIVQQQQEQIHRLLENQARERRIERGYERTLTGYDAQGRPIGGTVREVSWHSERFF
ncbi:hypothetical protein IQ250_04610, partial [Pseudanabaenaceae cyanobacterium LEGE 13415]|nr:hypothetical protein [Pseudanabaenaceae cyanobacterium LEGE 13415]